MLQSTRRLLGPAVALACFLLTLEVGLRLVPEAIPLGALERFQHELRGSIAQRRALWNQGQMRLLARDDGGPPLRVFRPHAKIRFDFADENERGTLSLDGLGFCNPARDDPMRSQVDVVAIGDSFAWCIVLDAESTWVSRLGHQTGVRVLNLGRGGIGPYEYLQILGRFGIPKAPEVVVMQIYEGNDLRDALRYHEHLAAAREGRTLYDDASDRSRDAIDYDRILAGPVSRRSYAVNLLVVALAEGVAELGRQVAGDPRSDENFHYALAFPERRVEMNLQNADESEVRQARAARAGRLDLSPFDAALERFSELAAEHDFTPLVTYAPSAHTAYAELVDFEDESLAGLMPWFSELQRTYLRTRSEALGIEFLDLTPALQRAARALGPDRLLYYPMNLHWTAEGNRVVADTVAPVVARRLAERTRHESARARPSG